MIPIPQALKAAAWREFRGTTLGKLVNQVEAFSKQHGRTHSNRAVQSTAVYRQVEKYAKQGQNVAQQFLRQLGPVGRLLTAVLEASGQSGGKRDASLSSDLGVAQRFIEAFGDQPGMLDWAKGIVEGQGYRVTKPGEQPRPSGSPPQGISPRTKRGEERKRFDLDLGGGQKRRFPRDHPIVTGEMVKVNSSNVHSYGYDIDASVLYVRFLATGADGKRKGAGSLYQYTNLQPPAFLRFHAAAQGSAGAAVWDMLRIRGTVSGHRYDYALVGVTRGYVPRKATIGPEGEIFIPREVRTTEGKVLRSRLPEQVVRPLMPAGLGG